ncbi:dolichyl-phosphate-mannose--protein mannosyltransferase [Nocardioides mesophilus]|uniref:Polyprenol-phosphate-mannose--protein mannosyltransferase n=1 Tax=Nocardioides mesophilus TaxID=433659 RepID=A0A7G9R7L0_9ACTN|nr:phospholipid carrier-dependent glycosyltransferase [Nocardioides mesophilus]QNN51585.1 phospholipid carrier-dependent glycosyltransferase [Nocardioides mesophilus]
MPTTQVPETPAAEAAPRRTVGLSSTADHRPVPSARRRLVPLLRNDDRFAGWAVTIAITMLAGFLRLWHLRRPNQFLFDETYYAKDAWSLLHHGFVTGYVDKADEKIVAGHTTGLFTDSPSMIVHPEVGKWLIALGEHFFGMNSLGWRVASAVVGTLMVLVMIRLVRRLTGSTLLGGVAGLLLCFDGMQLVLSRSALLDIFEAFFMLCAVACLVADRDWGRLRLARLVPAGHRTGADDWGPVRSMLWRPWRLGAGIFFGLACGTKWSAVYPLAAFGLLVWMWDAGARRSIGVRLPRLRSFVADALPAFGYLVIVALVVYVLTWTGWLLHAGEYERTLSNTQYGAYWGNYLKTDAKGFFGEAIQSLRSLWNYHQDVYTFHRDFLNDAKHTYQSKPQWWPILNRPVGMQAELGIKPGVDGCDAPADSTCLRQILLLGTPALWWGGVLALFYAVYAWVCRRDWRFGLALVGFVSTWLPWVRDDERPIFSYYSILMLPFTVIAITLLLGVVMGSARASSSRRLWGTAAAGAFVVLVVLNFAFFWPIWTGQLITTPDWLDRIWFRQWI